MDAASVQEVIGALPRPEAICCLLRDIVDKERFTE